VNAITPVEIETANNEITDDEIKQTALRFINETDSFQKSVELLLAEFDGITTEEAKDFVGQVLEDSRWTEMQHAEKMQEAAAEARDKELKVQADADHLFIENYGYKNRKRIKVSPEDEARVAKLLQKKIEQAQKALGPNTRLTRMDTVKKKKLYWLWQHRVPFGALSTLAGDPDQGKSLISLYLAARVSKGERLYGNTEDTEAGEVLLLIAEDDPEVTLRPRLEAAGADLSKIHLLESVMVSANTPSFDTACSSYLFPLMTTSRFWSALRDTKLRWHALTWTVTV
jgi:hypothetical protein